MLSLPLPSLLLFLSFVLFSVSLSLFLLAFSHSHLSFRYESQTFIAEEYFKYKPPPSLLHWDSPSPLSGLWTLPPTPPPPPARVRKVCTGTRKGFLCGSPALLRSLPEAAPEIPNENKGKRELLSELHLAGHRHTRRRSAERVFLAWESSPPR
ncbi:hypothetical protein JZ751_026928 [Albula glossodonta]|uniref:Uncharacterized protein n=1 Tax=Albula glossodonta TaxID=121402 RepID=A0A8T2NKR9_9TELE|nr:hypothetical protein JZ751_026928 [Albula glossodonta]